MYHRPPQAEQYTQLACLSLAKFSHTTTSVSHRGPLHWNHIIGNGDIIGIFERFTVSDNVLLKVFQGNNMIEQVNISDLARVAVSETGVSVPGVSKPTFAVVVKSPCLAVKYSTGNAYIRRFQIKFSQDRDYYTALAILSDIKCPFSEPNIDTTPLTRRPSTQWQMGSSSSAMGAMVRDKSMADRYGSQGGLAQPHEPSMGVTAASSSVTAAQASLPSSSSTMHNVPAEPWPNDFNRANREMSLSQKDTIPNRHTPSSSAPIQRPSTATTCYDAKSLETVLPPKRQLPFLKPAPQKTSNRPATSSDQIFRKPEQTNRLVDLNSKPNALKRTGTSVSPSEYPSNLSRPSTTPIAPVNEPMALPCPASLNDERRPQHLQATNAAQYAPVSNTPSLQPTPEIPSPDLFANLSSYLSSPTAERTKDLENWICQHIEDDGFVQLCQDVEGIWRRFAVGK